MNIGEKIKQLRVKHGLTQEELANRCDLSKGFISQMERNLTSPSIATLMDVLESLGTNLKDFFNNEENTRVVFHKDDIFTQENEDMGHSIHWVVPNAQKNKMEPIVIKLQPKGRSSLYHPHDGEVLGYCIQGNINLYLGSQKHKVKKGESFYHTASCEYYLENPYEAPATILWVTSPPYF